MSISRSINPRREKEHVLWKITFKPWNLKRGGDKYLVQSKGRGSLGHGGNVERRINIWARSICMAGLCDRISWTLFTMLALVTVCLALTSLVYTATINDVRPLVVWHGLGDTYASPGMVQFESEVKKMHPGIFVHSVYIDQDEKADQRAGFVGVLFTKEETLLTKRPTSMEMSINSSLLSLSSLPRFQNLAEGLMPSVSLKVASSCAHMWSEITRRPCTTFLRSDHSIWASPTSHCVAPLTCCARSLAVPQRLEYIANGHSRI
jgi:hypothetical protein